MKKIWLCCVVSHLFMQSFSQDAQALIATEKAFEKTCLAKGIRDGFLSFIDSNAIAFTENGPVNGKKFWSSLPVFDGVFTWSPAIAEISSSGDWGYTSGNYEHRPKSLEDPPSEFGQYTTVWQRYPDGQWKYLIDIGNPHAKADLDKTAKIISTHAMVDMNAGETSLLELEKDFILDFNKDLGKAYAKFCSNNYHLNFTGYELIANKDSAVWLIKKNNSGLEFRPAGIKISSAKDMAAVYGTLISGNKSGHYLRIWRYERDGWRIAMEVLRI